MFRYQATIYTCRTAVYHYVRVLVESTLDKMSFFRSELFFWACDVYHSLPYLLSCDHTELVSYCLGRSEILLEYNFRQNKTADSNNKYKLFRFRFRFNGSSVNSANT